MQKQGSDIYFGGFSKMKRFPFFDHIAKLLCYLLQSWVMCTERHKPIVVTNFSTVGDQFENGKRNVIFFIFLCV